MTRTLEILFRHKWRLLALLLAPLLLSEAAALAQPRQYQSTASLWALRRYEIIGATGPESDLQSPPAATQATALSELLQTRAFDLAVADDTDLPRRLRAGFSLGSANLQDSLYANLANGVQVTTPGYNLLVITYTSDDPAIAQQVVSAVIAHYGQQSGSHALAEGQQLLAAYKVQLANAQQTADATTQAAANYLQEHHLTPTDAQADPQYQYLSAQAAQARTTLANIQANIDTINQELATLSTGATGLYTVTDAPQLGRATSRVKTLLLGGGSGSRSRCWPPSAISSSCCASIRASIPPPNWPSGYHIRCWRRYRACPGGSPPSPAWRFRPSPNTAPHADSAHGRMRRRAQGDAPAAVT